MLQELCFQREPLKKRSKKLGTSVAEILDRAGARVPQLKKPLIITPGKRLLADQKAQLRGFLEVCLEVMENEKGFKRPGHHAGCSADLFFVREFAGRLPEATQEALNRFIENAPRLGYDASCDCALVAYLQKISK